MTTKRNPAPAAKPLIAEPTRAGWWVGVHEDGERTTFDVRLGKRDKNLFATSKHHPIGVAVGVLFMRGWEGPAKSQMAANELRRQTEI